MSIEQNLSIIIDCVWKLAVIAGITTVAWRARGIWDDAKDFLTRVEEHMNSMEKFAQTVMSNHMYHMQEYLRQLAEDKKDKEK